MTSPSPPGTRSWRPGLRCLGGPASGSSARPSVSISTPSLRSWMFPDRSSPNHRRILRNRKPPLPRPEGPPKECSRLPFPVFRRPGQVRNPSAWPPGSGSPSALSRSRIPAVPTSPCWPRGLWGLEGGLWGPQGQAPAPHIPVPQAGGTCFLSHPRNRKGSLRLGTEQKTSALVVCPQAEGLLGRGRRPPCPGPGLGCPCHSVQCHPRDRLEE